MMSDTVEMDERDGEAETTRRQFLGSAAALSALGVPDDVEAHEVSETAEAAANKPMAALEDDRVPAIGGSAVMEDFPDAQTDVQVRSTKLWDGKEMHTVAEVELGFPYGVFSATVHAEEARRIAYELLEAVEEADAEE